MVKEFFSKVRNYVNEKGREAGNCISEGFGDFLADTKVSKSGFVLSGTLLATLAGCSDYQVRDHISRGKITTHSQQEENPYDLAVRTFYGENYIAQEDEESGTGFALIPYEQVEELIDNEGKREGLEGLLRRGVVELSGKKYLAIPDRKDDNNDLREGLPLMTEGKYGIKARRKEVESDEDLAIHNVPGADIKIKSTHIGGEEFYIPYRKKGEGNSGILNFWTIPYKDTKKHISPEGQVTLINPGNIYEWVDEEKYEERISALEKLREKLPEAIKNVPGIEELEDIINNSAFPQDLFTEEIKLLIDRKREELESEKTETEKEPVSGQGTE